MKRHLRVALTGVVAAWLAIASALVASPASAAVTNYQGLWWNAPAGSESGWGINFAHQGDTLFATWFTYDATGKPWWLIALLQKTARGVYAGEISTVTGPAFNAVPFLPGNVVETAVGTATATFADGFNATFEYTVNFAGPAKAAVTQTKSITRQLFASPAPICVWGDPQGAAAANNVQGLWWNAPPGSEAGWGINFTHQGNIVFATWFTYDATGKPLWLIALLQKTAPGVYAGEVSTVTGPPFNAVPFPTSSVVETVVGAATVTFADGDNATFSYTVNGIAQTKSITRQVFAEPGTVCRTPGAQATAVGTPNGPAASSTIGPAGGSLTSVDGKVTLTIPPGALAGDVQFTIQPITNEAPGGVGAAYRLLPDGQTFAVPAQVAFRYDDEDLAGSAPESLGVAFQDDLQVWQALRYAAVDEDRKVVTASTAHLSDWSLIRTFQLVPAAAHVLTGEPRALAVVFCRPLDLGDAVTLSVSKCVPESGDFLVTGWAVNGVPGGSAALGTVVATGDHSARYIAPANPPIPNVVGVSAQLVGSAQTTSLASNITIDQGSWSGASSSTHSPWTTFALVKWTVEETSNSVTRYRASGTVGATFEGCQIAPSSVPINPALSSLSIDYGNDPPTFDGLGIAAWDVSLTCPDFDEPATIPVAVLWFDAAGVVTNGGSMIAGSGASRDGFWQQIWTFSRDE
jgi:hypothetical protein